MTRLKIYNAKEGKMCSVEIPLRVKDPKTDKFVDLSDVRPKRFKEVAQTVLGYFRPFDDCFKFRTIQKLFPGMSWYTAYKYLLILHHNGLVHPVFSKPEPSFFSGCETLHDQIKAKNQSEGSTLAAIAYDFVEAWSLKRRLAVNIIHYRLSNGSFPWLRCFFTPTIPQQEKES